jgi:hypothetical protein
MNMEERKLLDRKKRQIDAYAYSIKDRSLKKHKLKRSKKLQEIDAIWKR